LTNGIQAHAHKQVECHPAMTNREKGRVRERKAGGGGGCSLPMDIYYK
jgi:hypothetical protein